MVIPFIQLDCQGIEEVLVNFRLCNTVDMVGLSYNREHSGVCVLSQAKYVKFTQTARTMDV